MYGFVFKTKKGELFFGATIFGTEEQAKTYARKERHEGTDYYVGVFKASLEEQCL